MRRISVIGTSGSGKTTLAMELSRQLNIPHIELDALNWGPNWTEVSRDVFRHRAAKATAVDAWIACGNYGAVRDLVMARADLIIWLDYSMTLTMLRVVRRTVARCVTQQELWAGNRERFWTQLSSRDSLLLWVLTSWRRHRRDYPKMLRQQRQCGKRVLRFRSLLETRRWLATVVDPAAREIDCLTR
jgi:adenylate kinase family enzyme